MKQHMFPLGFLILSVTLAFSAHAASECDSVLRPNQEQMNSDYSVAQAYMSQSSAYEYDRLSKLDASARSAEASYKVFSAEYNDSNNREEFQEKVLQRLNRETFSMSSADSRALSRTYVSDAQVGAWTSCIASGGVLLVANTPNASAFAIRVSFVPPIGIGSSVLTLKLDGATVDGKDSLSTTFPGKSTKSFIVKPGTSSKRIVVTANAAGLADDISIDLTPRAIVLAPAPPPPPAPPVAEKLNPLFIGQTPACNAGIVTSHQGHLGCVNTPLGYTIKGGISAYLPLYLGTDPNLNAGAISTKSSFKGGASKEWGYTVRDSNRPSGAVALYVVVGCGIDDGEVTANINHKNCPTTPIGWAFPW